MRHPHDRPARILDGDLRPRAQHVVAPGHDQGDRQQNAGKAEPHHESIPRQDGPVRGVGPTGQLLDLGQHLRVLDRQRHGAPPDHEPAERGERHGNGDEQQYRRRGAVGRVEPQPEVQAEAAVHPHQQQQRALQDGVLGPQPGQLVEVVVLHAEEHVGDARVDDVREQEERNEQPKADLEQLPSRQPQRRPVGKLVERQRDVSDERHHQHERARQRAGDHLPPSLHLVHGPQVDEPDRSVEKMRGRKGEEDQPRADPEALSQVSAEQDVHGYNRLP